MALRNDGRKTMSEERFWLTLWYGVAVAVVLMTAIITVGICYHHKTMVENGYEEVTLLGTSAICWQKVQ